MSSSLRTIAPAARWSCPAPSVTSRSRSSTRSSRQFSTLPKRIALTANATQQCNRLPSQSIQSSKRSRPNSLSWPLSKSLPSRSYSVLSTSKGPRLQSFRAGDTRAGGTASRVTRVTVAGQQKRGIFIQTQDTPNQDALKFLPSGQRVLPEGFGAPFVEYLSARSTVAPPHPSQLAGSLMGVDGVTAVFYGPDYITVTKAADVPWPHVKPEVFALITEALTSGQPLVAASAAASSGTADGAADEQQGGLRDSLEHDEQDDEVVQMIKELLETRIRPAIQEDGGDIEFRGFEDGNVLLKLRGACRTCDSSTVTLKNGIENMLMHYIEEVKGVTQVLDEEEEVALREFAKFEEKLKLQKGEAAVAGSGGKGSLDTAE